MFILSTPNIQKELDRTRGNLHNKFALLPNLMMKIEKERKVLERGLLKFSFHTFPWNRPQI